MTTADNSAHADLKFVGKFIAKVFQRVRRLREPTLGKSLVENYIVPANVLAKIHPTATACLSPFVDELKRANPGLVRFGDLSACTAHELVLKLSEQTTNLLQFATGTTAGNRIAKNIGNVGKVRLVLNGLGNSAPPSAEWNALATKLERELFEAMKHRNGGGTAAIAKPSEPAEHETSAKADSQTSTSCVDQESVTMADLAVLTGLKTKTLTHHRSSRPAPLDASQKPLRFLYSEARTWVADEWADRLKFLPERHCDAVEFLRSIRISSRP